MSLICCEPKVAMAIDDWAGELPALPSGLQQWPWS